MLESIRQNLKGTLVVVVVIIFIVPMVISGVGTSFLGSTSLQEAATVDGESISNLSLDRAVRSERNRLLQMGGIDASSPLLEESKLKARVLERLTRRAALVASGKRHSMAMSDSQYAKTLMNQEAFSTEGNFDEQKFRALLAQSGFTSSSYKKELGDDLVVQQNIAGIEKSAFISEFEFAQFAKLTHQKRSFYTVTFPKSSVTETIKLSEDDVNEFYQSNQQKFTVPEKVKLEYLEISVERLAKDIEINEQDIRDQYEAEVANFTSEASYTVAHILIEDSDEEKIQAISERLDQGEDFTVLAAEYSDDIASSEEGGALGVLTPGMFPESFEQAALALEAGQVSAAVKTDSGTHFIKVLTKTKTEVPSFESRESEIRNVLALAAAQEQYDVAVDRLGELTFSSDGLADASEQLNLPIQTTDYFERNAAQAGASILSFDKVISSAFSDEVKVSGHNSNTIELTSGRSVVLRVADVQDSYVKALEQVREVVQNALLTEKTNEALSALAQDLKSSIKVSPEADTKALAESMGAEFNTYDLVKRNTPAIDFATLSLAFQAGKPSTAKVSFIEGSTATGDKLLVGVTKVEDGSLADIQDAEKDAIATQLSRQIASLEISSFLESTFVDADIKIN